MLKSFAFVAILTVCAAVVSGPATAQQALPSAPANLPPEDFLGDTFVDATGCVFVRAGVDGQVAWVPRVTRSREPVCGLVPTFESAGADAAPAADATPAPAETAAAPETPAEAAPAPAAPLAETAPAPAAPVAEATPAPAPVVAPAPAPAAPVVAEAAKAPASKPVAAPPPRVVRAMPKVAAPRPKPVTFYDEPVAPCAWGCDEGAAVVYRDGAPSRSGANPTGLPGHTRIVPQHVWENRDTQAAYVPPGYKPAWEDDRLNRYRAWQTVDGYYATQEVWTNTVPRRLVVRAPSHRVKDPVIVYRVRRSEAWD